MFDVIDSYEIQAEGVIVNAEVLNYGTKPVRYRLVLQEMGFQ
jgi:hypothetical protein